MLEGSWCPRQSETEARHCGSLGSGPRRGAAYDWVAYLQTRIGIYYFGNHKIKIYQILTQLPIISLMWDDWSADIKVIQTKTEAPGRHVIFFHNCQFSDLIGNPNLSKLAPVKNCCDSPLVKTTLKPTTKSKIPSCQFRVNYGLIVSLCCWDINSISQKLQSSPLR